MLIIDGFGYVPSRSHTCIALGRFTDGKLQKFKKPKKYILKFFFFTYNSCFVFKVVFHFVVLAVVVVVFTSTIILFFVSFSVFYHQKNFNLLHIICCCCFSFTVFCFVVLFVL